MGQCSSSDHDIMFGACVGSLLCLLLAAVFLAGRGRLDAAREMAFGHGWQLGAAWHSPCQVVYHGDSRCCSTCGAFWPLPFGAQPTLDHDRHGADRHGASADGSRHHVVEVERGSVVALAAVNEVAATPVDGSDPQGASAALDPPPDVASVDMFCRLKQTIDNAAASLLAVISLCFSLSGKATRTLGVALSVKAVRDAFEELGAKDLLREARYVAQAADAFRHLWGGLESPDVAVSDILERVHRLIHGLTTSGTSSVSRDVFLRFRHVAVHHNPPPEVAPDPQGASAAGDRVPC